MSFLRRFGGGGPYMGSPRGLGNPRPDVLSGVNYQIVAGPHGLAMAQLGLRFSRGRPAVSNPDMTLAVVLDRSGSMSETYRDGHVLRATSAILAHVEAARTGFDLVFYDTIATFVGPIRSAAELQHAVSSNQPAGGGTRVTAALRGAIQRYRTRSGLYMIVVTDGEFEDKQQVRQLVESLLPQVTAEAPYAFRLHFVGAGEGVDRAFLQQLEALATDKGVPLVTQHHHAHLRHSHDSILDELDRAFVGEGLGVTVAGGAGVTHVGDAAARVWRDGAEGSLPFLPRRALIGVEYATSHAASLEVHLGYADASGMRQDLSFAVPLPHDDDASRAAPAPRGPRFHLPWHHDTPEQERARHDADLRREQAVQRAAQVREAELRRQAADLQALGRGGIPTGAAQRLAALGRESDDAASLFTSNLDPDETALLRRHGYRVRGLVTGSAMYHVGQPYASSQQDVEVRVLSAAYDTATELAASRMGEEVRLLGAHGVVGVRLTMVRHEWGDKTVEVQLVGTAVEGPGPAPAAPWLSDLSGQEWWALHRAGYEPAGLVWGHCSWFILTTQGDEYTVRSFSNQELTHWSKALGRARTVALEHARKQARAQGATGLVGVHVERRVDEVRLTGAGEDPAYEREHHTLVVSIVGTSIRLRKDAPRAVPRTTQVLSLRDGRLAPAALTHADASFE